MSITDVSPRSHIDTPAWQSFEARMRARAAEHRAAKRRRRLQYAALLVVGVFGIATGWFTVASLPYLAQRIDVQTPPPPAGPQVPAVPSAEPMPIPAPIAMLGEPMVEPTLSGEPAPDASPEPPIAVARPETASPVAPPSRPPEPRTEMNQRDRPVATSLRVPDRDRAAVTSSPTPSTFSAPAAPPAVTDPPVPSPPSASSVNATARPSTPSIPPVSEPPATREATEPAPEAPPASASGSVVTPPAPPAPDLTRVRADVRSTIERYRSAYERLDAAAARSVWPAVDAAALSRAFESLESQRLAFDDCAIDVAGSSADATCTGRASIVPKVGGGSQTVRRTWRFKLAQEGDSWTIASATVR